jgi:SAM-dependent methyltransferase
MIADFYTAFEHKFRGSHDVIKDRLRFYLPFILPLKEIHPDFSALDLGCGRGEWLDLLRDFDFPVIGVDFNEGMISVAVKKGGNIVKQDALAYLNSCPTESLSLITAFHFIEHIDFEKLQSLIEHAHRVLRPGGILIMETPNPENITVSTKNFYLDPTHKNPIPPDLLFFASGYYGFSRSKIVRMQEAISGNNVSNLNLNSVLEGASQDYAVIAQKESPSNTLAAFDEAFGQDYGSTTFELAELYSDQIAALMAELREKSIEVELRANQIELRANQIEVEIRKLYTSRSWKVTAPLRFLGRVVRRALSFLK